MVPFLIAIGTYTLYTDANETVFRVVTVTNIEWYSETVPILVYIQYGFKNYRHPLIFNLHYHS